MRLIRSLLAAALFVAFATPAFADATVFIGTTNTPSNRAVKGFSFGAGFLVVAFEFEYSDTSEGELDRAPSLRTGMGNVLLQTPVAFMGFQPYFTTGAGLYRETLGIHQDTSFGFNTGGGAKITLIGPLRLRVDYRVFKLGGDALYSPAHRIYVGLNLKL